MGFCALGLGFMKKNNRKMGMGFQFEQHRLGLWDLSWDLKKTISWEMGLGPPLHDPLTLSTQLIKPNYLVILPPTQHHSFFRNLPPLPQYTSLLSHAMLFKRSTVQ